jgi:hypothetical protein
MVTPRNAIYRSSCNGISIRIVITPDLAYLAIRGRGHDHYRELAEGDVAKVLAEFQAIGTDPEKFAAFVNAAEAKKKSTSVISRPCSALMKNKLY